MHPDCTELEKIGFIRNTVSQLSVPATPPRLPRRPEIDLSVHSSDKTVTPPEGFKLRFYELCDRFKNFYHIYTDGIALCHKHGTSAIRLPGATGIFNAELHAIIIIIIIIIVAKITVTLLHKNVGAALYTSRYRK